MASYDFDERYWTPHSYAQYPSPFELIDHASSAYYKDDCSEPINYSSSYNFCEYSVNPSETRYSQPKFLQHYQVHFPSETEFTISQPEFEEYDPTPYDGGYDQTVTYGKPLPPSDLTCYPRSRPKSGTPPLDNFSYDSTPSPYGKDDPLPVKPSNTKIEAESRVENGGKDAEIAEPTGSYPSYEHQIPYGSGLEAMDICESIFGYWPCLAKKEQQQQEINRCQLCHQDGRMDPWKAAADYFFGTPLPYDYDTHHHHLQSPYRSDQISWLQ